MASSVSLEEFQAFHTIDRQVYARLVSNLGWDPHQSKKVIAFWNWLEMKKYINFVKEMQQVPDDALLNAFAHEAITCMNCLFKEPFNPRFIDNDRFFCLTRRLAGQDFSLRFLYENSEDMVHEIGKFMMEVCDRAFSDIVPSNLANGVQCMVPYNESLVLNGRNVTNGVESLVPYIESLVLNGRNVSNVVQSWAPYSESSVLNGRNVANGVQPWAPYSESSVINRINVANVVQSWAPSSESSVLNGRNANGVQSLVPKSEYLVNNGQFMVPHRESQSQFSHGLQDNECHSRMGISQAAANVTQDMPSNAPQDDRTLYITFSKGRLITKQELIDHITRVWGDCVEEVYLHIHPQLFARVIFRSPSVLEEILGDNVMVKFSINGKDACVRRKDYFTSNSSRLAV